VIFVFPIQFFYYKYPDVWSAISDFIHCPLLWKNYKEGEGRGEEKMKGGTHYKREGGGGGEDGRVPAASLRYWA
jgi:hypothetical protein